MTYKRIPFLVLASACAFQASAANIVIQNNDGANEGFNDPNAPPHPNQISVTNTANTLGALRLEVFEEAAKVWGDILNSNITITVGATFDDDLFCSENSATLGRAGPTASNQGFTGSDAGFAYVISLAESLSDSNQNGGSVEINAKFNSNIDTNDANCMGGGGFYYGLDDNAPAGTSALFPVVLHELGHGLGFLSLVNDSTGSFNTSGGNPDTFSRNLKDLATSKTWVDMNNAERLASSLNEPDLIWAGAKVTADRSLHLGAAPELVVNAPGGIAGTFEALLGEEPTIVIPGAGVTSGVVDGNNFGDGCSQINEASFNGKIILFDETDSCITVFPAFYSEFAAGAVGVIIADTTGSGLPDMSGQVSNQDITIPYIGIRKSVADNLRANIGTANVTIGLSASKLNGENQGMVKMYAPAVFEQGSSVSHWSRSASPDLLMEPVLGTFDHADVDLTAAAFRDIGWSVNIPGGVLEVIFEDGFE